MTRVLSLGRKQRDWAKDEFYTSAVVLGLDIGIEGIGVWLRKGQEPLHARTYLYNLPEAAPLAGRRGKRSGRRARQSRAHRDFLFGEWCERHGFPTAPLEQTNHDPYMLRYRAITKKLGSKEALVICLRHLVLQRGYDYHLTDEGAYPWGDELKKRDIIDWARTTACPPEYAEHIRFEISEMKEADQEAIVHELEAAERRYAEQPIRRALEAYAQEKKPHLRKAIRGADNNYPRDLVIDHLKTICERHRDLFPAGSGYERALSELIDPKAGIINYHRKEPGALAERKIKKCPYAARLSLGRAAKCGLNGDLDIRCFKVLCFLAERRYVDAKGQRRYVRAEAVRELLEWVREDVSKAQARKPRRTKHEVRAVVEGSKGVREGWVPPTGPVASMAKKDDMNKAFLEQLGDLLRPQPSVLKGRASLSAEAAAILFREATDGGTRLEPDSVRKGLERFYDWRRDTELGGGHFGQVQFLLGPRRQRDPKAVHGVLRRIMADEEVRKRVRGKSVPDYVVVEVIGDIPRNRDEAQELQKEQRERQAAKQALYQHYELPEHVNESDRKRAMLYDQQNGKCPYTGKDLGSPLSKNLQIDHLYPRARGGLSVMQNLVLTHSATNNAKGDRTPKEAAEAGAFGRTWDEIKADVLKMKWRSGKNGELGKQDLFLWDQAEFPEFNNTTRVAQLARELRDRVAQWLEIKGNPGEMSRRIGTPSGYLTARCRASWGEKLPKKDRNNLRHHLWDAAVVSHIPPGKGLNQTRYGGIFYYPDDSKPGEIDLRALAGLGPDLIQFEKEHADDCLVIKPRRDRTKKARFDETIYGADEEGRLWARKPLVNGAGDETEPAKEVEKWLKDSGVNEGTERLPPKVLQQWLESDGRKPLLLKGGTEMKRVAVQGGREAVTALAPHCNHLGEIIGYKKATETFARCEIWVTETRDAKGRPKAEYHRRFIPHPRGLRLLQKRILRSSGERLTWERHLTEDELKELGLHKELAALQKARAKWQETQASASGSKKSNQPQLFEGGAQKPAGVSATPYPQVSLRKIYSGLPPHAKRLTDAKGTDISRIAKGDLLRVPLNKAGRMCDLGEVAYRRLWYRVTAINQNRQIEMTLAERKPVKKPAEAEVREGKARALTDEERWYLQAQMTSPRDDAKLATLLIASRSHDTPPHSGE